MSRELGGRFFCKESSGGGRADSGERAISMESRIWIESSKVRHSPALSFAQAIFAYATFSSKVSGAPRTLRSLRMAMKAESLYTEELVRSFR